MNLYFFIRRLTTMSAAEVINRIGHVFRHAFDRYLDSDHPPGSSFIAPDGLCSFAPDPASMPDLLSKADRICSGRIPIFALENLKIDGEIDYHRDYKSGKAGPSDKRGTRIDYRAAEVIGDIKYIWEPNRQLFLPILALAYISSGNPSYLQALQNYLAAWLRQNPYPKGVNWSSPLEMGIRLINWTLVWNLAGSHLPAGLVQEWQDSALRQARFIHGNFSRYSSANNHLIGEAAGLYIASTALLTGPETARWREKSLQMLCREILLQNTEDGVNREQSLSYQQFTLDFFILAAAFSRRAGDKLPPEYAARLEKMLEYLAQTLSCRDEAFSYGDDDDGLVIDLLQKDSPGIYRSLLRTGASLFDRPNLDQGRSEPAKPDLKTSFIGFLAGPEPLSPPSGRKMPDAFPLGGRFFLGRNFGTANEEKLLFDCGPLGYLSIAAHGHADALSFIYGACGLLFFVDPGTYAYHSQKKWRDYFRGTSGHNTVVIDKRNQSQILGNFMWGKKARSCCLQHQPMNLVSGVHDGYRPMVHKRTVHLTEGGSWIISDEITGTGPHQAEIFFHLHPEVQVSLTGPGAYQLERAGIQVRLQMDTSLTSHLISGQEEPPLGWYSPSYDQKIPSPVIRGSTAFSGKVMITCVFHLIKGEE